MTAFPQPQDLDAIIFDFDGVLTDNCVYVDQNGLESVRCNRSDGLGFDMFRAAGLPAFILSTETNPVVQARARKLRIPAIHGSKDKAANLTEMATEHGFNLQRCLFIGNDVNDLPAMAICGHTACPADAHATILDTVDHILSTKGGAGVARELADRLNLSLSPTPNQETSP